MQIADVARHYDNSITDNTAGAVKNQGVETTVSNVVGMKVGHVFEGTINGIKNGQVVIGLSNGETLTARLDSGVSVSRGQSLFFQVKSNENGQIQIRAITGQFGTNPTLEKALNAASLPINERNLAMVNTMMQEKMSIDSASLQTMYRSIMGAGGANPQTVVQMTKFGIQISPENISQFENYKADQGAVMKELTNLMTDLPNLVSRAEFTAEQGAALNRDIMEILTGGKPDLSSQFAPAETLALAAAEAQIAGGGAGADTVSFADSPQAAAEQALFDEAPENVQAAAEQALFEEVPENVLEADEQVLTEGASEAAQQSEAVLKEESILAAIKSEVAQSSYGASELGGYAAPETIMEFTKTLTEVPWLAREMAQYIKEPGYLDPKVSSGELLGKLTELLNEQTKLGNITREDVTKILSSPGYKASLKNLIEQNWLLRPDEVAEGADKIKELYTRLATQIQQLEQALDKAGVSHQNFSAAAADVSNNITFMNELNSLYTYVQLPLKLSGQNANGELYVYTNKKKLKDPDAELTAFLHFDLEHLGSTDVAVKLYHKNVTTDFCLENEEAFNLIANNIHLLDNRLRQKGYTCSINVTSEDIKQDFVNDFLQHDDKSAGIVHRYSFDVRA